MAKQVIFHEIYKIFGKFNNFMKLTQQMKGFKLFFLKIKQNSYSETSQDRHPLMNEKMAVLQRWPSYGGHLIKDP